MLISLCSLLHSFCSNSILYKVLFKFKFCIHRDNCMFFRKKRDNCMLYPFIIFLREKTVLPLNLSSNLKNNPKLKKPEILHTLTIKIKQTTLLDQVSYFAGGLADVVIGLTCQTSLITNLSPPPLPPPSLFRGPLWCARAPSPLCLCGRS